MTKRRPAKRRAARAPGATPIRSQGPSPDIPPAPESGSPGRLLTGYLPPSAQPPTRLARSERPAVDRADTPAVGRVRVLRTTITTLKCAVIADQAPQALGVTCWFDARPDGDPYDIDFTFHGTKHISSPDEQQASFTATRTLTGVLPGIGTMAYTARFADIDAGEWTVTAKAVQSGAKGVASPVPATATGHTAFRPVISELAPGMSIGVWPAMVGLGALAGVVSLLAFANRYGIPVWTTLALAVVACIVGVVGAKVYYIVQATERASLLSSAGMCIQGFVIGAFATIIVGARVWGLPWPSLLDIAVPGLMLGMLVGRFGCWRGGCCAGRPSTSRLAVWSTDRQLGVRRIPVQLIEGAAAAAIGVVAAVLAWRSLPQPPGALFAAAIAAYVIARQLLFSLRGQAQHSRRGRYAALALASAALAAAVWLLVSSAS